jgi:hypothetical protein
VAQITDERLVSGSMDGTVIVVGGWGVRGCQAGCERALAGALKGVKRVEAGSNKTST